MAEFVYAFCNLKDAKDIFSRTLSFIIFSLYFKSVLNHGNRSESKDNEIPRIILCAEHRKCSKHRPRAAPYDIVIDMGFF